MLCEEKEICDHVNSGNYKSVNKVKQASLLQMVTEHMIITKREYFT